MRNIWKSSIGRLATVWFLPSLYKRDYPVLLATIGYLRVSSSEQSTQSQLSEIANRQNVECWSYAHASEASASSAKTRV